MVTKDGPLALICDQAPTWASWQRVMGAGPGELVAVPVTALVPTLARLGCCGGPHLVFDLDVARLGAEQRTQLELMLAARSDVPLDDVGVKLRQHRVPLRLESVRAVVFAVDPDRVAPDPFDVFRRWLDAAQRNGAAGD